MQSFERTLPNVCLDSTEEFDKSFPDPLYYCIGVYDPTSVKIKKSELLSQRKISTNVI